MKLILPLSILGGLLAAGTVFAQGAASDNRSPAAATLPLEVIVQKSIELFPGGRVVETDFDDDLMRDTYDVELVDATGAEWDLEFDASTGELLKRKQDRD